HRVLHADVLVDIDLVDVDDGRAVDDDVVDDPWPSPADPRRPSDEPGPPPPRHDRLTPPERDPALDRPVGADGHARRPNKGNERRWVGRPPDDRTRRPCREAIDEDPTAIVIRRPAPRCRIDP